MEKSIWREVMHVASCIVISLGGTICAMNDDIAFTPTGSASIEGGQIQQGYFHRQGSYNVYPIAHVWQQNARVFFGYDVTVKKALQMNFLGGGLIAFSTPQILGCPVTLQTHHIFYIASAHASYSFGNSENLFLKFQLGFFPYKYNPDVRNLGEYLFRTLAYPLLVYSDFDNPKIDMLGLRVNFQFADKLIENDLLLHSELIGVPVQDWSVSDILSSTVADMFTIGVGISFSHYLSVYQGKYPKDLPWADPSYYPKNLDPNLPLKNAFKVKKGTDSAYLDWRSLRGMARFSIDPKPVIPLKIFGKNDLKLYGEMDIIGFKNYPYRVDDIGYDDIKDRIFYTAGFNFPGFRIIDLINMEMEYCANKSAFSDAEFYGGSSPSLLPVSMSQYTPRISRAVWRWSVYLKKSFFEDHFSIIGQAARDHKKINFYYFEKQHMSFMEALPTINDWWWTFKTEFRF